MGKPLKSKKEQLMLRVVKNGFEPADQFTARRLLEKQLSVGDLVLAAISKPRNPGFHRLAHQIGALCAQNIEDFAGLDAHTVLKRIQIEGRIACDEIGIKVPGVGYCIQFIPRSLSYGEMSQEEFYEVVRAFCHFIAARYWKTLTPEEIEPMAKCFVEAV